ncbi:MAG: hypothetical protein K6V73_11815 [Firmicutes bacterium]|nr:hypothetical protein [Bacillota bacterium]
MGQGGVRALAAAAHLAVLVSYPGLVASGALALYGRARGLTFLADQGAEAFVYQAAVAATLGALDLVGAQALLGGAAVGALHLAAMAYGAFGAFSALDGRRFRYLGRR